MQGICELSPLLNGCGTVALGEPRGNHGQGSHLTGTGIDIDIDIHAIAFATFIHAANTSIACT